MNKVYKENKCIELSYCNPDAAFGLVGALDMFMNIAENHEEAMGFGIKKMCGMDRYWIIGRSRVEFLKRPEIMDNVILSTWFDKPKHLYVNREYLMEKDGETLVKGETEWLVAVGGCKKLVSIADFMPAESFSERGSLFDFEMVKVSKDFSPEEKIGCYTVKASDTDFIGHMNNVSYARALAGFLSRDEICGIKYADLFYSAQCCENDDLGVYKRTIEGGAEYALVFKDGKTAFTARLIWE